MKLAEGKEKFLQAWGTLGSSWGINRTMAQVHALLMISPEPLTAEEIMDGLNISRGNANMNVRALIDWGLVSKELRPGERKEYFVAEKDIWKVAKQVIKERRRREIEPIMKLLNDLSEIEGDKRDKNVKAFTDVIGNIKDVVGKADSTLDVIMKADENWFVNQFMKLMK
jgi:DNA-binding transcriptional regulator GbsR (MarR family)